MTSLQLLKLIHFSSSFFFLSFLPLSLLLFSLHSYTLVQHPLLSYYVHHLFLLISSSKRARFVINLLLINEELLILLQDYAPLCVSPRADTGCSSYLTKYIYGVGEFGFICWGPEGLQSCHSCCMWMYLEYAYGLSWPPNLWHYWLTGLSSLLSGLSHGFHPGNCLLFLCRE